MDRREEQEEKCQRGMEEELRLVSISCLVPDGGGVFRDEPHL